jgi:hypothetical protein
MDAWAGDWYAVTQSGCLDCLNSDGSYDHVARGGLWATDAEWLRAATRFGVAYLLRSDKNLAPT